MNMKTHLKALPVMAALTIGLAFAPTASMADDDDRGRGHSYSHDGGKHDKGKLRAKRYERGDKHRYDKKHRKHHKHRGHYYGHRHGHKHKHYRHDHHGHRPAYVVNNYGHDHYYRDRFIDLSDLRFMIGVHTGNFDLIFRD